MLYYHCGNDEVESVIGYGRDRLGPGEQGGDERDTGFHSIQTPSVAVDGIDWLGWRDISETVKDDKEWTISAANVGESQRAGWRVIAQ